MGKEGFGIWVGAVNSYKKYVNLQVSNCNWEKRKMCEGKGERGKQRCELGGFQQRGRGIWWKEEEGG
jgi:hypothetical protein